VVERIRAYRKCLENLMEEDNLKDPGVETRIIVKCIFEKWD
jgi:hypothetical protein